ncbi:MAG: addiction module toxin RelE [Gallionella sp.]|nr:addiction module toxin RelE [Gallionella sp.]
MKATFVELPPFLRHRQDYLSDESFRAFQQMLMENPEAGDVIEGTGGLRKVRFADEKRGKGKRGGLRAIYYWWLSGKQFWLFTLYNKDEMDDLTAAQRKTLKELLKQEVDARR